MEAYRVLEQIGEGSFGKVFKGRRLFTGQFVALKFVSKAGKSAEELENLRSEIATHRRLDHPNIILLLDYFETPEAIVLVMELAHGELFAVMTADGALSEDVVRRVAVALVSALRYLASHRIMHRDLKPQNCLLTGGGGVKLADFGFARQLSAHTLMIKSVKGTPLYMAPELFTSNTSSPSSDVWSLGVLLYELRAGRPPFNAPSLHALMQAIVGPGSEPSYPAATFSPPLAHFLRLCMQRTPEARPDWTALAAHPFLTEA